VVFSVREKAHLLKEWRKQEAKRLSDEIVKMLMWKLDHDSTSEGVIRTHEYSQAVIESVAEEWRIESGTRWNTDP